MIRIVALLVLLLSDIFYMQPLQAYQDSQKNQSTKQQVKKILLVVAMDTEASPIINALKLKKSSHLFSNLPMKGYAGKYNNLDVFLIINGKDPMYKVQNVGTQAATLAAYLGIEYFHPDLVISAGTAGGIGEYGARIGDTYVSKKIYFYDRRISMPGYRECGMGGYNSENFEKITNKIGLKSGVVCSGGSFDQSQVDKGVILNCGCSVTEMEAAGVAWVSMLTQTPMIAVKGITDIVDSKTGAEDFEKNFPKVTKTLAEKIRDFLDLLGGKQKVSSFAKEVIILE